MKIQKMFRGKTKEKNEWIYGGLAYINDAPFVIYELEKGLPIIEEVEEASVGQYSSVFDKNNVEMCEGDVVYGVAYWLEKQKPAVVAFQNGSFGLLWHRGDVEEFNPFTSLCNVQYDVVGNVLDNPELLEEPINGNSSILNKHIFYVETGKDGKLSSREIDAELKVYFSEQLNDIEEKKDSMGCSCLSMYVKADSQDEAELMAYRAFQKYLKK